MTPDELTERYFSCILATDIDGLAELYEDEATFVLPDGREFIGKAAILEMQRDVFSHGALAPTPVSKIIGANAIAVEIETRLPDGTVRKVADLFDLSEEGRIQRLCVYMQGG